MRRRILPIGFVIALIPLVFLVDYIRVGRPVSQALEADTRNSGFTLRARQGAFLVPSTLVLDVRRVESAAPVDLLRAVFQTAEVFNDLDRKFDRVVLQRSGKSVYNLDGKDFREMGLQYASGETPVYMIRKFPSKLYLPDGSRAFSEWTGGFLGVLTHEMDDANEAVARWHGSEDSR